MAMCVYVNRDIPEAERRASVFQGDVHLLAGNPSTGPLVAYARELIQKAFGEIDPETCQYRMDVADFVTSVSPLKGTFTNSDRTKELVARFLLDLGYDPDDTYFDLPRLRVVPSGDYLTSGVSYAYRPHRDTWYAHPTAIVDHWVPVFDVVAENVMALWPAYWDRPMANTGFDYDAWVSEYRFSAADQVGADRRPHPVPAEMMDSSSEIRIAPNAGDIIVFSPCHLHATAPNDSGKVRFSFDLRTISVADLASGAGPRNLDAHVTGSTLQDFLRVGDLAPLERV
jgi:hypothetical protein